MKNKINKRAFTVAYAIGVGLLSATSASAYDVDVHYSMSKQAILRSALSNPYVLYQIGLYPELHATWLYKPSTDVYESAWYEFLEFQAKQADAIAAEAAKMEDHGKRSLQHFFDPSHDRALQVHMVWEPDAYTNIGIRSPQWTLGETWTDLPPDTVRPEPNRWSIPYAKYYLERAIKSVDAQTRSKMYGNFMAAVGHSIHHIQDMAQPDHVRNDPHCDAIFYCGWVGDALATDDIFDPSAYEAITAADGYAEYNAWDYEIPNFAGYRAYWSNLDQTGLADFTNQFAVSPNTNFRVDGGTHPEFSFPNQDNAVVSAPQVTIQLLNGNAVTTVAFQVNALYEDKYLGLGAQSDHKTSAYSLYNFDLYAAKAGGADTTGFDNIGYALANDNYRSAAWHLLPRAEAYSAGLVNYLLRGALGVKIPENGIYGIADQLGSEGFTALTVQLRNETADVQPHNRAPAPQQIGGGELVAVASYRLNPCYESDLSGELHVTTSGTATIPSETCSLSTWIEATEQTRIESFPVFVDEITSEWTEYEFNFQNSPIPFGARDLEIYFVFRGELGEEEDAIVVARHEISEPTYISSMNMTDFIWMFDSWQDASQFADNDTSADDHMQPQYEDVSYRFTTSGTDIVGTDRLDPKTFHRYAVLVDPSASFKVVMTHELERNPPASTAVYTQTPLRNETRPVKDVVEVDVLGWHLSLARYANQWCDENGCTLSGLKKTRGVSHWSNFPGYWYIANTRRPTEEEMVEFEVFGPELQRPVTVSE